MVRRHVGRLSVAIGGHPVLAVFLLALIVRVAVAVIVYAALGGTALDDDATYWEVSGAIAEGNPEYLDGYAGSLYAKTRTFIAPLMTIRSLGGDSPLWGQLFVTLFGAGTAAGVTFLAREALPKGHAVFPGLVVALMPSQVLWSSLILKDAAVWFVLAMLAVLIAKAGRSGTGKLILLSIGILVAILLLAYLRQHTLVVASWALMLSAWVGQRVMRYQRWAFGIIIGIAVPWITGYGPAGLTYVVNSGSIEERRAANAENAETAFAPGREQRSVSQVQQNSDLAAQLAKKKEGLAAVADNLRQEVRGREGNETLTPAAQKRLRLVEQRLQEVEAELAAAAQREREAEQELARIRGAEREPGISHLGRGISVMLAEPYPWDVGTSLSFRMAQAEALLWYPVLGLALLGLLPALRRMRVTLFPLLFGGAIMLVYALVEGNVGTAYRHRGEFVWVVALLTGFGLLQLRSWLKPMEGSDRRAE